MKFLSLHDKQVFLSEIERLDLIPSISEDWAPTQELEELFIRRRRDTIGKLKDFRKSQNSKSSWRKNRWKHLSGLRTFARSTKGKRFHRELGRIISTRDFNKRESFELHEFLKATASARTHAFIETEFYHSLMEQLEYDIFLEGMIQELHEIEQITITAGIDALDEGHMEFLYRITEATAQIKAFADASGKTEAEVETLWDKAKNIVTNDYKKTEEDEGFYSLVVGIVKKMCGLGDKK